MLSGRCACTCWIPSLMKGSGCSGEVPLSECIQNACYWCAVCEPENTSTPSASNVLCSHGHAWLVIVLFSQGYLACEVIHPCQNTARTESAEPNSALIERSHSDRRALTVMEAYACSLPPRNLCAVRPFYLLTSNHSTKARLSSDQKADLHCRPRTSVLMMR